MKNIKNIYGKRSFSGIAIKLAKTKNSRGRQQKKKKFNTGNNGHPNIYHATFT